MTEYIFRPCPKSVEIGRLIRQRRKALGLTQNYVARELSTTVFQLWAWEKGKDTPDLDRAQMLSSVLGGSFQEYTENASYTRKLPSFLL